MTPLVLKVAASALAVAGVNVVARSNPSLGGWLAALPVVSILSIVWLASDGASAVEIGGFIRHVLIGLVPTAGLLALVALGVSRGFSTAAALGGAAFAWGAVTLVAHWTGLLDV